jgi:DNA-directed RNA polymerase specialized sigma24 family protein
VATTTLAFNSTLRPAETGYHDMALVHTCKHANAAAFEERYSEIIQFRGNSQFLTCLTRITINESLMNVRKQRHNREFSIDHNIQSQPLSPLVDLADCAANREELYRD